MSKFLFHHKWSEVWLLVKNWYKRVTSQDTVRITTYDLGNIRKILNFHIITALCLILWKTENEFFPYCTISTNILWIIVELRPPLRMAFPLKSPLSWSYDNFFHRNTRTLVPHLQYNLSHMIKSCFWRHGHKLWVITFKIPVFEGGLGKPILLKSSKIVITLIKTAFKKSKKVKRITSHFCFLILEELLIPGEKCSCKQNSRGAWFMYLGKI